MQGERPVIKLKALRATIDDVFDDFFDRRLIKKFY
jgi:hypothetical protein